MATLHSKLQDLASSFANSVLDAIRGASLDDLLGETGAGGRRGPGRPSAVRETEPSRGRGGRSGRLKRRSPDDIAKGLEQVVALLKKNKGGLRAEQIREHLGMQSKEMPRILKEGLHRKALKCRGQKRATTYVAS
jgi:hypothetical protein